MNSIETLLDQPVFQALGWTLIHFIWQGALIAVLYVCASLLLRRFSANVRYAAACGAMSLMLIAPALTILSTGTNPSPPVPVALLPDATDSNSTSNSTIDSALKYQNDQLPATIETETESSLVSQPNSLRQLAQENLPRTIPWLLPMWFAGVLFFSFRFAGGLVMVNRLKRTDTGASIRLWQENLSALSRRLRVSRPVRLCESALVEVPTVIGWLRPVILLPASALTGLSTVQLEALLAHELAHIRRYDYLVNLLQTSIETLFFYHPAVWWVSSQVRQEREHCCDDLAVAACGDVLTYARALTALEQLRGSAVPLAVAANGGSLLTRIQRLLRRGAPSHYGFESGLAGFIALAAITVLLAGGHTALLPHSAQASAIPEAFEVTLPNGPHNSSQPRVETSTGDVSSTPVDRTSAAATPASPKSQQLAVEEADSNINEPSLQDNSSQNNSSPSRMDAASSDFISDLTLAGLVDVKPDQVVALKLHGITAEVVREMSTIVGSKLTVDRVLAMRIHGVTSAFAADLKAQGLARLNAQQLVAFRIHGITPQYIAELREAGYDGLSAEALVAFGIHGVSAALVRQLSDIGVSNLTAEQINAFAIHGVTPMFIQTMRRLIGQKLTAEELIALRIHGITPESIKALEVVGFTNLKAEQLVAFRIHKVTPAFIQSIREAGYDRITIDQLEELSSSGVTPEFIQKVRARGFVDPTPHQLAVMRRLNILPSAQK